jgi:hypothetical protein
MQYGLRISVKDYRPAEEVAQAAKSAVSQVAQPADATSSRAPCRFGNRRYGRLGSLRHTEFTHPGRVFRQRRLIPVGNNCKSRV